MSQRNRLLTYVVDDENVIASTLELILISQGFDARAFVDPLDALEATRSETPNLLITDVMMPQMNGIELAIQVTQRCPECKILLFSGQAATGDLYVDAKARGYKFDLLAKPVHPTALLEKIKELVGN